MCNYSKNDSCSPRSHVLQFANWHKTVYFSIQERLIYVVKPLILCKVILSRIITGVVFIKICRLYLIHLREKSHLTRLFRI